MIKKCNFFSVRINNFYTSSSSYNCQLADLDVDQTLNSDINEDSAWNIYEKIESPSCDSRFDGGGGGILDPTTGDPAFEQDRF